MLKYPLENNSWHELFKEEARCLLSGIWPRRQKLEGEVYRRHCIDGRENISRIFDKIQKDVSLERIIKKEESKAHQERAGRHTESENLRASYLEKYNATGISVREFAEECFVSSGRIYKALGKGTTSLLRHMRNNNIVYKFKRYFEMDSNINISEFCRDNNISKTGLYLGLRTEFGGISKMREEAGQERYGLRDSRGRYSGLSEVPIATAG